MLVLGTSLQAHSQELQQLAASAAGAIMGSVARQLDNSAKGALCWLAHLALACAAAVAPSDDGPHNVHQPRQLPL